MKRFAIPGKLSRRPNFVRSLRQSRSHNLDYGFGGVAGRFLAFEALEERTLLSIAQDLVSQLTPYQSNLSTALDAAVSLPLVSDQLADLPEFDTIFQNSLASINAQTQSITANGHYQLPISLPSLARSFSFDLGLDAFLDASAAGTVQATVNPTLMVGFNYLNGTTTLDVPNTRLDLGFNLSLPSFQATMKLNGLLYVHAVDTGTSFQGNLGFKLNAGSTVTPQFSGEAHVLMGLTVSFAAPAANVSFNPTFRTTLDLDWAINPATNQLLAPSIALVNFGLEADGFLDGFLGDIVTTVQKFSKPIQPFIDVFQTPVPILSAFGSSETIGTLMLQGAGITGAQQDAFVFMIDLIDTVNKIDLSGGAGGAIIPFGTIHVTGNAQQAGAFGFDTSQVSGAIDDVFNSAALQAVEDALQDLGNYAGTSASAGFKFPLLENPAAALGSILTGQPGTLFEFTTGRQHFDLSPSIGVGIEGLFGIFLSAGITFDANLTMGYDTAGLIALAQDPGHNPSKLLRGFYFDNSIDTSIPTNPGDPAIRKTGIYLQGFMELSASAIITVSGGLYADVNVELVNTDATDRVRLDSMIGNLTSGGKVFKLGGRIYASADLELTFPNPLGPDITLFSFNLGYEELLNFNPPPPPGGVPITVIDVVNQRTLLLDVNTMPVGSQVRVEPFHDLSVTSGAGTFEADGIRVDYANETVLFVERKNNLTTNHYNLIGLNGATPDAVSINVIDPFRVFIDEGATNPYAGPTKPGVLLAGGKNVVYRYNEAADGTKPTVLFAGGFGSNTLTGGTMMFGNFIPATRIVQAKSHFANTSGYDAQGQALINSVIDAAIAPVNPAGVIGAKMTGSRGGLMFGGAGNNSFIATGGGVYEMIGGNWVNSFDISPSFRDVPANYQIDGGGGDSELIVRVPAGETADFENGTVPDKYRPEFKALDIFAKENRLFTTAHGIKRVLAYGTKGSTIILGDTSELDIDFKVRGSGQMKFGGSSAPDAFDVTSNHQIVGFFAYGTKYHRTSTLLVPKNPGVSAFTDAMEQFNVTPGFPVLSDVPGSVPFFPNVYANGPYYTIARTFGTNGRSQSVRFDLTDVANASLALDGRGAADQYHIAHGLGSFLDITIDDTDETTQNSLVVDARLLGLHNHRAMLTDNSLKLEYYTPIQQVSTGTSTYYYGSTGFSPTVFFDANTDITLGSHAPFLETIINRPTATQHATVLFDSITTGSVVIGFPGLNRSWDSDAPIPKLLTFGGPKDFDIIANGGNLSVQYNSHKMNVDVQSNTGALTLSRIAAADGVADVSNIFGNTGTITIDYSTNSTTNPQAFVTSQIHVVNVLANAGTINLHDAIHPALTTRSIDAQINVGNGSLAAVHGTINLSNERAQYGLKIDDRTNPGVGLPWTITAEQTRIGDLTINYAGVNEQVVNSFLLSKYEAFPKSGALATVYSNPPFITRQHNGIAFPFPGVWLLAAPANQSNFIGEAVSAQAMVFGNAGGAITYSASNLPAGLSINPTTGLISGTIGAQAYLASPYVVSVVASNGTIAHAQTFTWDVRYGITIEHPAVPLGQEGAATSFGPITASNRYPLPVTLSVSNLPPGLMFNPLTRMVTGTISVSAGQNGPYLVTINATDGVGTASVQFNWDVTGISLTAPPILAHRVGNSVNQAIPATTASGLPIAFSANNLPDGLSINPVTGTITGTVSVPSSPTWRHVAIHATQGNDSITKEFYWNILPAGASDVLNLFNPSEQHSREGDLINLYLGDASTMGLAQVFTATGLPPGLSITYDATFDNAGYVVGRIAAGASTSSPYTVHVSVNNGQTTDQVTFQWIVDPSELLGDFDASGTVDQGDYVVWRNHFGNTVSPFTHGDGNGDGKIDAADFTVWRDHIGQSTGGNGGAGALSAVAPQTVAASSAFQDEALASFEDRETAWLRTVPAIASLIRSRRLLQRDLPLRTMDVDLNLAIRQSQPSRHGRTWNVDSNETARQSESDGGNTSTGTRDEAFATLRELHPLACLALD